MVNAGSSAFAVPILKNPLMEFRDVILNQDQKSSFNETIDEYSGALYVSSTDLTIPGNGGLDINIVRHYSTPWTSNSKWDVTMGSIGISNSNHKSAKPVLGSDLGEFYECVYPGNISPLISGQVSLDHSFDSTGWVDTFPTYASHVVDQAIKNPSKRYVHNPSLTLPGGSVQTIVNSLEDERAYYPLKTNGGWRGGCLIDGYVFYSPEGLKYTFGGTQVEKIEDKFGNFLKVKYDHRAEIKNITSNDGRNVVFHYGSSSNNRDKLTSISVNGVNFVTYSYDSNRMLKSVRHKNRVLWKYTYKKVETPFRLASIENEAGAIASYEYTHWGYIRDAVPILAVSAKTLSGTVDKKRTTFEYIPIMYEKLKFPDDEGYIEINSPPLNGELIFQKRIVRDIESCAVSYYHSPENSFFPAGIGKPTVKKLYSNSSCSGTPIKREVYGWNSQKSSSQKISILKEPEAQKYVSGEYALPLLESRSTFIGGVEFKTLYEGFTRFGMPLKQIESSIDVSSKQELHKRIHVTRYNELLTTDLKFGLELLVSKALYDKSEKDKLNETVFKYDNQFNLTTKIQDGVNTHFRYHSDGNLKSVVNALNQKTLFEDYYRGIARKKTTTNRYSNTTMQSLKEVDYFGNLKSSTDWNGTKTSYQYDSYNRLISIDLENDAVYGDWYDVLFTYNNANYHTTEICSLDSSKTACESDVAFSLIEQYDGMGRLISIQHSDLQYPEMENSTRYQSFSYDKHNRKSFESFISNSKTESKGIKYQYDVLDRVVSKSISGLGITSYDYASGNKIKTTDAKGYETTTTYQLYGKLNYELAKRIESPENVITDILMRDNGLIDVISQSGLDGNQNNISTTEIRKYNSNNQLCLVSRPDVGTTLYGKNELGQITWKKQGAIVSSTSCSKIKPSKSNTYVYDNIGDLWKVNYSDNTGNRLYIRDNNGNLTRLVSGNIVNEYRYNNQNKIQSESLQINNHNKLEFKYKYLKNQELASVIYPNKLKVEQLSNGFGEVIKVHSVSNGRVNEYSKNAVYYPNGALRSFTYGNGISLFQDLYDDSQLVKQIEHKSVGNSLVDLNYSYDLSTNVTSIVDKVNSNFSVYDLGYDGLNRLTSTVGGKSVGSSSISYDGLGNIYRKKSVSHDLKYHYDYSLNRLKSVSGISGKYNVIKYDTKGNITDNGAFSLSFDDSNQLKIANGQVYSYDGNGKRVYQSTGSGIYSFYSFNGNLMYREEGELNSGNGINYIYMGSKLIAKHTEKNTPKPKPIYTPRIELDIYKVLLIEGCPLWGCQDFFTGEEYPPLDGDDELGLPLYPSGFFFRISWKSQYADSCQGKIQNMSSRFNYSPINFQGLNSAESIFLHNRDDYYFQLTCSNTSRQTVKKITIDDREGYEELWP